MALENSSGNYLRICEGGVDPVRMHILTDCWKDAATRQSPSAFDQPIRQGYDVAGYLDLDASADDAKSVADNLLTAGYAALKQLEALADFDTDA